MVAGLAEKVVETLVVVAAAVVEMVAVGSGYSFPTLFGFVAETAVVVVDIVVVLESSLALKSNSLVDFPAEVDSKLVAVHHREEGLVVVVCGGALLP